MFALPLFLVRSCYRPPFSRHTLLTIECANRYLISGGKLKIEIYGPRIEYLERYDILLCPDETFRAISTLFHNGTSDDSTAQKKCNTFLYSIGLKIIHLNYIAHRSIIEVSMTLIDRMIGNSSTTN